MGRSIASMWNCWLDFQVNWRIDNKSTAIALKGGRAALLHLLI